MKPEVKCQMKQKIEISIIVPVYNAERFLETTIQSVLRQNAPWAELVLVNDGSRDGSPAICQRYSSEQVQYISIPNGGAGHARNVGIDHARGDWILFLDSDDLIRNHFFTEDLRQFLAQERQTDILYTPKVLCDFTLSGKPEIVYPEPLEQIRHYMPDLEFWACIYRTEFLRSRQVRFFEYQKQDVESAFRFRAFSRASCIKTAPERIFYVHRDNPSSNVNTWNWDKVLEIKSRVYYALFREFDRPEQDTKLWLYTQSMYYAKELLELCRKEGFQENEKEIIGQLVRDFDFRAHPRMTALLPVRYRVLVRVLQQMQKHAFVWNAYCHICARKQRVRPAASTTPALEPDHIPAILERLDLYTGIIESACTMNYPREESK